MTPPINSVEQGLFRKFDVRRVDGSDAPGGKHHGCRYFVLDVDHDPHAVPALVAYADACEATHPQLAQDIRLEWQAPFTPVSAQRAQQPCPDCYESSGYVWEFGNDWEGGPWGHQTNIPCKTCLGAGVVAIHSDVDDEIVEMAARAAFRAAQSEYRASHDHFPLRHTWETTDDTVRSGWRRIARAVLSGGRS